ncbi:nucleotidyl transferase AbiEii/AbiGii toxin family protein [Fusibacter sp. 3D3]|uniref:nucleotidyl transferase AbiEii/AbiGii toxin family protein n=1 Tax=Fusibacter sp. 3D3 TaxID=1048380 RepID=UPI000852C29A|nr:nucleotidyl transferase AbiEii/AbiGii toxin family protein [Fusibacter sp. 3D3]GAU79034.1 hypothetical protein F3D3_3670 [Fusibacter sp. 3D3]
MNADSVKAKLKKSAKENKRLFQDELVVYCLERTIYRISQSKYNENFTLKGGIFLYAVFDGDFSRATRDIDLLGRSVDNTIETMRKIFEEIFSIKFDDAIVYDLNSISIKSITELKEYPGINVTVNAMLDKTRVPVSIDIGFGDVVYPKRVVMGFPTLLDMEFPKIYAYSVSSVVAEKFEAIVSLGYANSRFKDFYDVYLLINKFNFDGNELSKAIEQTFGHRKTPLTDIVAFEEKFYEDRARVARWNAFINKKRAMSQLEFGNVIEGIKKFLVPVVVSLKEKEPYEFNWSSEELLWK